GVAVVSGSGGAGIIAADMAARHGVPMPQPEPATVAELRAVVPEFGAARNPCDPTGQVLSVPESYGRCCRALLADPQYGVLVCAMSVATKETGSSRATTIAHMAREQDKPLTVAWVSEWLEGPGSQAYEADEKVTLFRSLDRCFETIAAWQAFHAREVSGQAPVRLAGGDAAARARILMAAAGDTLVEREAKQVLAAYGVPVIEERLARNADEAVAAAQALGYPVVLKAESPTILHKTELGVVRLNVADESGVRRQYAEIVAAARGHVLAGVLVQPMASGVEVIVGARMDPAVGPVVVVGSGGVLVELMQDSVAALAPVTPLLARRMLKRLKGYRLLAGFRGAKAVDVDALADAVARISEFAADFAGEVSEMDVNPLRCSGERVVAVDALITKRRA
ncbi:MAG: CoA-binding protein, partial [Betaproteobacteria bacterium]|nr:CoA-binding protein [Betaproteobacteria bacterium]